jgi:multiple sugar transport system permease protein
MSQGVATTLAGNTPPITEKRKKNLLSDGQGTLAAVLISPTMLVILFVVGIPILLSLRESVFLKATTVDPVTGLIPEGESFVGLANFTNIFNNPQTVSGVWGSMDRLVNSFWH